MDSLSPMTLSVYTFKSSHLDLMNLLRGHISLQTHPHPQHEGRLREGPCLQEDAAYMCHLSCHYIIPSLPLIFLWDHVFYVSSCLTPVLGFSQYISVRFAISRIISPTRGAGLQQGLPIVMETIRPRSCCQRSNYKIIVLLMHFFILFLFFYLLIANRRCCYFYSGCGEGLCCFLSKAGLPAHPGAAPAHGPEGPMVQGPSCVGFFLPFVPDSSY